MKHRLLAAALITSVAASTAAVAEIVVINDTVAVRESTVERPARGMSMDSVEAKFGAPSNRHATVGQPPITRWDYPGFSVFFENQTVLHAVAVSG